MPSSSSRNGCDLLGRRAGDRQPRVDAERAQSLERAKQDGQALALLGAAEEQQAERGVRRRFGPWTSRLEVDAVGDDPVAAAVEALGRPRAASDTATRTCSLL